MISTADYETCERDADCPKKDGTMQICEMDYRRQPAHKVCMPTKWPHEPCTLIRQCHARDPETTCMSDYKDHTKFTCKCKQGKILPVNLPAGLKEEDVKCVKMQECDDDKNCGVGYGCSDEGQCKAGPVLIPLATTYAPMLRPKKMKGLNNFMGAMRSQKEKLQPMNDVEGSEEEIEDPTTEISTTIVVDKKEKDEEKKKEKTIGCAVVIMIIAGVVLIVFAICYFVYRRETTIEIRPYVLR